MRRSIPDPDSRYAFVVVALRGASSSIKRRSTLKKTSSSQTRSGRAGKAGKARGPVRRDSKEEMAELLEKLSQKLDPQAPPAADAAEERQPGIAGPNRDRLTVGVDLGDKWSNYCILGLDGEKLTEGDLGTTPQEFVEFFQGMAPARVVMEVGTHSAWAREASNGMRARSVGSQPAADGRAETAQAQE